MSKVKHLSFEELAGNLTELFNKVRTEHTSIVVEYATGEKVLIKPYAPTQHSAKKARSRGAVPVADDSGIQPLPNQPLDTENASSVGAVYDLDPDSITPG
jgi:hypothetical protein